MTAQGKANYEAWRKAGGWQRCPSGDLEYDDLRSAGQHPFDAGADAVELVLAEFPVDEDMPGEPKPATVIVVTEAGGRERRYAAPDFGMVRDGTLIIGNKLDNGEIHVDAMHARGHWARVHKDGTLVPDSTAKALGIAKQALDEILRRADDGGQQPLGRPEIGYLASTALNDIWTETEG